MSLNTYFKKLAKENSRLQITFAVPDPDYAVNLESLSDDECPPSPLYNLEGKIVSVEDDFLLLDTAIIDDDTNIVGVPFGSIAFFQPFDD